MPVDDEVNVPAWIIRLSLKVIVSELTVAFPSIVTIVLTLLRVSLGRIAPLGTEKLWLPAPFICSMPAPPSKVAAMEIGPLAFTVPLAIPPSVIISVPLTITLALLTANRGPLKELMVRLLSDKVVVGEIC